LAGAFVEGRNVGLSLDLALGFNFTLLGDRIFSAFD